MFYLARPIRIVVRIGTGQFKGFPASLIDEQRVDVFHRLRMQTVKGWERLGIAKFRVTVSCCLAGLLVVFYTG